MMRSTSSPAMRPASFVACRCESLKYAGTVITAWVIFVPSRISASAFSLPSTIAEISAGVYCLGLPSTSTSTTASPLAAATTLYGTRLRSSSTSENLRPMNRLIE